MESYNLLPENGDNLSIILYGFNENTRKQLVYFQSHNISCPAIIDQRGNELKSFNGIKIVSSIKQILLTDAGKNAVCCFIMLNNGQLHLQIADTLFKEGIRKVLFIPMVRNSERAAKIALTVNYGYMLQGKYECCKNIPILYDALFLQDNSVCDVIMKLHDEVIVNVPVSMIYTNKNAPGIYSNVPIIDFDPYNQLFAFFSGNCAEANAYISDIAWTDKQKVIGDRRELFNYYEYEFTQGMDYFISAAATAKWNTCGYFNVVDGHHRVTYLLSKQLKKIPLRITQIDYECMNRYLLLD